MDGSAISLSHMKTPITALLATTLITFTASASQQLLLESTVTENHAKGDPELISVPRITVESGKPANIQVGNLGYTLIPTLHYDGMVDIRVVMTDHKDGKVQKIASPRLTTKLGEVAVVQIGQKTSRQPSRPRHHW